MKPSSRPPEPEKQIATIAAANGWTIATPSPPDPGGEGAQSAGQSSVVVSGGELSGPAVLTVTASPTDGAPTPGMVRPPIRSEHLPRPLPSPPSRRTRGATVTAELVEHPPRGTLDDLLSGTGGLTAGEAVTVLASVARGLADVHSAGWAGVRLSPADVGFRDDGCPVLTGADRLRPLDASAARQDVDAYAALAATTCAAVAGEAGAGLLIAATAPAHTGWHDVVSAVLGSADPVAVLPLRPERDDVRPSPVPESRRTTQKAAPARSEDALRLAERLLDGISDRPIARAMAAARAWIRERPVLAVVAAAPLLVACLLLIALPGASPDEEGRSTQNRPAPGEPGDSAVMDQMPRLASNAPPSRRFFTATRNRAASAPSTMR